MKKLIICTLLSFSLSYFLRLKSSTCLLYVQRVIVAPDHAQGHTHTHTYTYTEGILWTRDVPVAKTST